MEPSGCNLACTTPAYTFPDMQNDMVEVAFEEFGVNAFFMKPSSWFSAYEFSCQPPPGTKYPQSCFIIDSGFSSTQIFPFIDQKCIHNGVRPCMVYVYIGALSVRVCKYV